LTVFFAKEQKSAAVPFGITVLEAARQAGVTIEAPCNGMGTCGKCKAVIDGTVILACQTKVESDITVYTESKESENRTLKILSGGLSFDYSPNPFISKRFDGEKTIVTGGGEILGVEPGDTTGAVYGLVADIGTTTLVVSVVNLQSGEETASESRLNPQSAYAQDVLSRIHFAGKEDGLITLQNALLDALNEMIDSLTEKSGIDKHYIYEAVYSGNTAMIHLACGVDPKPLGQYPYTSQIEGGQHAAAKGLNISPFGVVYLPPVISAFVGPDITSGVLASQLHKQKETVLFIDIGTNGEMVLAKDGRLAATSTAAGPAFEGMNISCGMRAGNGAVERFSIDAHGGVSYETIGNVPATGICGSGLLEIVGELVRTGLIQSSGRFDKTSADTRLRDKDGKKAYFITDSVYLSQDDIRQVQLAKGAIRSGIEALLTKLGLNAESVERVEIAGSFGFHLSESSLLDIGLLPFAFKGKVKFVGNTSQSGGIAFLLNKEFRKTMKLAVSEIEKIELSNDAEFEKLFVSSIRF